MITRQIAKNTWFLYIRMILIVIVSLYTVRIVLSKLGAEDYGIYSVVGGVVALFSFLNGTMSAASQRFFSYSIGENDFSKLRSTFSATLYIYIVLVVVMFLLAETIGLYFFFNVLNIPATRVDAAFWVYQFSIISFLLTMLRVPYNSLIIAHERMNAYAFFSIVEVGLKLLVAFLLSTVSSDKLVFYSILLLGVTFVITFMYWLFCFINWKESHPLLHFEKKLGLEILSFSGWNLFGAISSVLKNQGVNIILNIFFCPTVNAARALSLQVNLTLSQFSNNFYTAIRPQIIKKYAAGMHLDVLLLMFQSTKFAYFLLLIITIPFLLETEFLLSAWLGKLPPFVIIFTQISLIDMLLESLAYPLMTVIQASGQVRNYQIIIGLSRMMNLPLGYIVLYYGYPPESVFFVMIFITLLTSVFRLFIVKSIFTFSITSYLKSVIGTIFLVSTLSFISPVLLKYFVGDSLFSKLFILIFAGVSTIVYIYVLGLKKQEKQAIHRIIKKKLIKK